jgi:hypothetical protein
MWNPLRVSSAVIALSLLAGCGPSGPPLTEVEGTLTLDGQPVKNAELIFLPQNVKPRTPSYGRTDQNGHFTLKFTATKSGAIPATHQVTIDPSSASDVEGKDGGPRQKIPKKYLQEGAIVVEVKDGPNNLEIKLDSN